MQRSYGAGSSMRADFALHERKCCRRIERMEETNPLADATTTEYRLAAESKLKRFVADVLERYGVAADHAAVVADVLVAADMRGIESHGVARLESYYVGRIRSGHLNPAPDYRI